MANIKGIDISKYQAYTSGNKKGQSKIDFKALKACGYDFVILRAGYGKVMSQKDIAFESHYKGALAAGLHIGAYHYTYAKTIAEAEQEAKCFLEWIKGKQLDYPVAFDIEDNSLKSLSTKKRTDICLTWMNIVEKAGYYTMLYTNPDWAKNYLDMDKLSHFDVWLACYTTEERRKILYKREILGIWQHTSSLILPTVYNDRLDANISYKDYASIIKKAKLNNLDKVVPEVETIEDEDLSLKVGDIIQLKPGAKYYNGQKIPTWVTKKTLYVRELRSSGNEVVFSTQKTGAITGIIKRSDIVGQ